jgi:hypothetical protein
LTVVAGDPQSWHIRAVQELLTRWKDIIADYDRQLEVLRSGKVRVRDHNRNVTAETISLVERHRAELQELIAKCDG